MGKIRRVEPVTLICGVLARDDGLLAEARDALASGFGAIDCAGEVIEFGFTDYYAAEMGSPLLRQFVAFAAPFDPTSLAEAKRKTNAMELDFAVLEEGRLRRRVNLDPGYICPSKLVLATTKDFPHRVCIGPGIYAEVTLQFGRTGCIPQPWTYPDYRSGRYDGFMLSVRQAGITRCARRP
jgi:hypothetical protein